MAYRTQQTCISFDRHGSQRVEKITKNQVKFFDLEHLAYENY